MKNMIDDFKKFTLEQFGKEIYFKKSDKIDTFESLFGAGLLHTPTEIGVKFNQKFTNEEVDTN